MTNRLANSNSPYLLQHKDNPVDWYPWDEEALEAARREDKPVFLSIGYAACHWCHVMAHESFEDPETAALMNENFINIKVDREERPDLDNIYMNAVVAMTGHGGWPMSVFLTPQGEPFYGGTYFPPVRRFNMPSFREVLVSITRAWREDRQRLLEAGRTVVEHLEGAELPAGTSAQPLGTKTLEDAAFRLAQAYDWKFGGWGQAPKFPQPMAIEFLLRRAARGDSFALEVADHALRAMAKGGMYDLVGGGFARYSTDDLWLVPHFEKMLYDNAQLAQVYLYAFLLTGNPAFQRVCTRSLDFLVREMWAEPEEDGQHSGGGFYSSLDADSEGAEGKFYIWNLDEIRAVLQDPQDINFFVAAHGVTATGNFEGHTVLQRSLNDEGLADQFNLPVEEVPEKLESLYARLLEVRAQRVRPGTDDKVLVAWNGLALATFAEAARYLKRDDYLDIARQNADFLLSELHPGDRLLRSWRQGRAQHNAYLEDYGSLILGLLALYQTDPDLYWYNSALELAEEMLTNFRDPQGGFFDTRDDHGTLIVRPKDLQDNATPSGNALAAQALFLLSAFSGRGDWRTVAEQMLSRVQSSAVRYPTAFGKWLVSIDLAVEPFFEVAIVGDRENKQTRQLQAALWQNFRPNLVSATGSFPAPENAPALLRNRPLKDDLPTAYVCQGFTCRMPVNSPENLAVQLAEISNVTGQ